MIMWWLYLSEPWGRKQFLFNRVNQQYYQNRLWQEIIVLRGKKIKKNIVTMAFQSQN